MKQILVFAILILTLSSFSETSESKTWILYEDIGFEELSIGQTADDVFEVFGKNYQTRKWLEYSYEIFYPELGISFWYEQEDTARTIVFISVLPASFTGKTSKGLLIHSELTLQEVLDVYGTPYWSTTEDESELCADYDELGISFYVDVNEIVSEKGINFDEVGDEGETDAMLADFYRNRRIIDIAVPF